MILKTKNAVNINTANIDKPTIYLKNIKKLDIDAPYIF
jgi:hypothetical protein